MSERVLGSNGRCALYKAQRNRLSTLMACGVALSLLPQAKALQNEPNTLGHDSTESIVGFTAPHHKAVLGVTHRGMIANIYVHEGSFVPKGELLFSLEDSVQQARLRMAQAAAQSTIDIELAKTRWDRAKQNLVHIRQLEGSHSAASKELTDSTVEETMTRLEYQQAKFQHEQAKRAYQRELAVLNEFRSLAPFAGYVSRRMKEVGELVIETEGVVELAQLDPLTITIDSPLSLAPFVRAGDRVRVTPKLDHWKARDGVVIFTNKVADGASQTIRIKVSVGNADGHWPAGLKVAVAIPNQEAKTSAALSHKREPTHSLVLQRDNLNKK